MAASGTAEQPLVYDEMKEKTGIVINYTPRADGAVELKAASDHTPDISATFPVHRIDEAHILYMESTELLRSRAKLLQSPAEIRRAQETLFSMFRGERVPAEVITAVSAPRADFPAGTPVNKPIDVDGVGYDRFLVKTRLITTQDTDLLPIIEEYAGRSIRPGDMLFVSEKALTITQGRVIDISEIKPSWFAHVFARNVQNNFGTAQFHGFGHGTPLAMQLLIEETGYVRAIFAAVVSALTRPFGIRGAFYYLCGKRAKSVDLPMSFLILEYAHSAKLAPKNSSGEAKRFRARLGCEVVILDANYRGAFSLGKSIRSITETFIGKLFRDNPMGQSDEMTPFCIVRKQQ
ncbi:MAG TPA: hypothetical protein VG102_03790 [Candidatus Paceibacterota bacterium]|jgi:hypothetical protein|nr:hypothetical protein [Candidatus Paceibacterota bacterium]